MRPMGWARVPSHCVLVGKGSRTQSLTRTQGDALRPRRQGQEWCIHLPRDAEDGQKPGREGSPGQVLRQPPGGPPGGKRCPQQLGLSLLAPGAVRKSISVCKPPVCAGLLAWRQQTQTRTQVVGSQIEGFTRKPPWQLTSRCGQSTGLLPGASLCCASIRVPGGARSLFGEHPASRGEFWSYTEHPRCTGSTLAAQGVPSLYMEHPCSTRSILTAHGAPSRHTECPCATQSTLALHGAPLLHTEHPRSIRSTYAAHGAPSLYKEHACITGSIPRCRVTLLAAGRSA